MNGTAKGLGTPKTNSQAGRRRDTQRHAHVRQSLSVYGCNVSRVAEVPAHRSISSFLQPAGTDRQIPSTKGGKKGHQSQNLQQGLPCLLHHRISSMQLGHIRAVYGYGPVLGPVAANIFLQCNQGTQSPPACKLTVPRLTTRPWNSPKRAKLSLLSMPRRASLDPNLGLGRFNELRGLPTRFQKGADA